MRNFDEFKEELLRRKAARSRKTRKRILLGSLSVLLCAILVAGLMLRPATQVQALDLMDGIKAQSVEGKETDDTFRSAQYRFALRLFKACQDRSVGENTLLSPLSVMLALSMTANGAAGETLEEMESVLGLPIGALNAYLKSYVNQLPDNRRTTLHIANSIWFRDDENRLQVNQDFLQTNANYYGAAAYAAPFNSQTVADINVWVKENTDGMIDQVLDRISEEEVMYLINALYFDAQWEGTKPLTSERNFWLEDGTYQEVTMITSTVDCYLKTDNATGFKKDYAGGDYQFVALLPNEDVTLDEFLADLTPEKLQSILDNAQSEDVITQIPEFELDYQTELSGVLAELGMDTAFDEDLADLSGLGTSSYGNLFIGAVAHKTHITLNTEGTQAAAVTVVDIPCAESVPVDQPKQVLLNRPFLYMIVDSETNLPLFMGTVYNVT